MKKFTSINDVEDVSQLVDLAKNMKKYPFKYKSIGENKTIGLIFFNPSLRTRLSTQKAALNLGMNVIVLNIDKEGWQIEMEDGVIMNEGSQEHIKDAVTVISEYCDVIGVRTFANLTHKKDDYNEKVLSKFLKYASVPVISLESAIRHPLQSLADVLTINEYTLVDKPKVVLTWAPHPKALPQAVSNSFVEWVSKTNVNLIITNPVGFDLSKEFTKDIEIIHDQNEALKNADFVYVKNWSSYDDYGRISDLNSDWTITKSKMDLTNDAKIMHCLPVRRNVVVTDEVLDSDNALILTQAQNRTYAAQAVLLKILNI
jgi:N-succinyl-L-ornithine transcarbamylase